MIKKTDVLIIGGGFAGLSCFQTLDRKKKKVNLLTNRNHFLFTPLLPLAAVGSVEVRSIVEPIFTFEKERGEVIIGEATDIFPNENKLTVQFENGHTESIGYEHLVLAMGAKVTTYQIPGVSENCCFIKEMKDARALREKIIFQFEKAVQISAPERSVALTFLTIGAGATGVETACEIYDLIKDDMLKHFPDLAKEAKILIVEAGKEILMGFDRTLAQYAARKLRQKGIELRMQLQVSKVESSRVILNNGESIAADTIIWAAGNGPQEFTNKLSETLRINLEKGRIPVDRLLRVIGPYQNIYAMGDCAALKDTRGHTLPATAQIAMKEGLFLAKKLNGKKVESFHFRSMGMLASLGSGSAIADLGFFRFKGILAWWFWKAAYLTRLVSVRNKVSVAFDWVKLKFFGRNIARIDF